LQKLLDWLKARAEPEPQVAAYVLSGLCGVEVDDMRRTLARKVPNVILSGLSGLNDAVSWELRAELLHDRPHAVARSIGGRVALDERAAALRSHLFAVAPDEVLKSLTQLADDESFALRERFFETHAKSVQGLGSEEAFEVRERAAHAAPLSSLSALSGLTCERSFALRARYLRRAPKLVMESLRRVSAPRAWEMRRETVREIKEAVDSIVELDDAEAWQLREDFADVWPSTVVKSLGLLADGERGTRLIRRQLARHAENISLLKHAAAVALKTHHSGLED
jgi:dTMP kinase